ncbi:MAG: penicillin-binding protein 2 [Candidatus Omnitrophica bacterium]|nr:penicillin-binding protein 2 [Candidatus Omnitrophota bacterium]
MDRIVRLQVLLLCGMSLLVLRLAHLQIIRGGAYRQLAEQNRLRVVPEQAPRGLIVDRRGRILADNQTIFRVTLVPQELKDLPAVLARLSPLVGRSPDALQREYRKARSLAFIPATIVSRVSKETALRLEEERWRLPGLLVKPETVRHYPLGSTAAHLLGYLSEPTAEELPVLKQYGVRPKQLIGRLGIERMLDHELRGRPGGLMVEVNNRARQVRVLGQREPEAGSRVELTIDAQLESLIEQVFGSQPGAAVVLDPETGEVLAMVSMPAFPPGAFAELEFRTIRRLLNDPDAPLMNRAAVGVYPPGSTAKLMTAAAGLEQRLLTPATSIPCSGALTFGDRAIHCWYRDGHGPMNLTEALMQSCNVYFMQLGRRLGLSRLRTAMEMVGYGRRTGWPLEERAGHLPSRRLTEGEVALLAIGQGEFLMTPLQGAVMAGAFANGGWLVHPWVIRSVGARRTSRPPGRRRVGWSIETIEAIRKGMRAVVQEPSGTGHRAFTPAVSIAGKTGTAQTHVPDQSHGWFVGYCPVEHPRAAMAIVAEHGGSGGDLPAEIAKAICEYIAAPETL